MKNRDVTKSLFGAALNQLRKALHLSQEEVARRMTEMERELGWVEGDKEKRGSMVSSWERGEAFPKMENLLLLLAACSPDGETVDFCKLQGQLSRLLGEGPPSSIEPLDAILAPGSEPKHLRAGVAEYARRTDLDSVYRRLDELQEEISQLRKRE